MKLEKVNRIYKKVEPEKAERQWLGGERKGNGEMLVNYMMNKL